MLTILFLSCSAIAAASNEMHLYTNRINGLMDGAVQIGGIVDQRVLGEFCALKDIISKTKRMPPTERNQLVQRLSLLIEQLPTASKILQRGSSPEAIKLYEKELRGLKRAKNKYAQPLIDLKYKTLLSAVRATKGEPEPDPDGGSLWLQENPYDQKYKDTVDTYIKWANKFQKLGDDSARETRDKLLSQFTEQFDKVLRESEVGQDIRWQIMVWLGGEDAYLTRIMRELH